MKQISNRTFGFAVAGLAAALLAVAPAAAEDFTAGKTPAQLFHSDCSTCHRSPNGLVKQHGDIGELTAFLREHYTTKSETAAALAAYVSGLASRSGPGATRDRSRNRSETDAPPSATADVPADTASEQPPQRRRRNANTSDGERKRAHDDADVPRPPRRVGGAANRPAAPAPVQTSPAEPPSQVNPSQVNPSQANPAPAPASEPHDADGQAERLRSYLSSGLDSENASAHGNGTPRDRKRQPGADDAAAAAQGGDGGSANSPPAGEESSSSKD